MSSPKPQCCTPRDSQSPAGVFAANEAWMKTASCTPAPPPLYDTQWMPSPPESLMEFYQDTHHSRSDNHCFHSSGQLGMSTGVEGGGDFGSKLLEYAFSRLQQDQAAYAAEDEHQHHNRIQKSTIPSSRKASTKPKTSRDSSKRPPLSSLAATHPSLYRPAPPLTATVMGPPPPASSTPPKVAKRQDSVISAPPTSPSTQQIALENEIPPWQRFKDPKRLQSDEPKFDDPTPRYLLDDVRQGDPKVISIVPLIGMPLGNIIEAANIYPK